MTDKGTRILIVEDEPIVALDISSSLDELGYVVIGIAHDGKEAIQIAEKEMPDIIIMDIVIKGNIDGIETAARIRNNMKIPTIFVTGYSDYNTVARARDTIPYGYLVKPFTKKELYASIETAISINELHNRIEESENRYRLIVENMTDVVFTTDMNFIPTFVSPSVKQHGYTVEEALKDPLMNYLTKESIKKFEPFMNQFQSMDFSDNDIQPISIEVEIYKKDKSKFWTEFIFTPLIGDNDQPIGTLGVSRDITERKHAEQEIVKLSDALENAADIVFMTDAEGNIEYVNHAFESITGYTKNEAIGKNPRILKSEIMDDEYYQGLYKTLLEGQVFRSVVINKKKNGELFDYDQTVSPHIDSDGNIIGFISTGKDVTERRQQEALEKSRLRGELTGFFVSSLPVFASGITPAVREKIILNFSDRFESNIRPDFKSAIALYKNELAPSGTTTEFDQWISWLKSFLLNIGITSEFEENQLTFANCPWEEAAKENAIFCLMCRTMIMRSSTWIKRNTKVIQKSVIANGSECCIFEIS